MLIGRQHSTDKYLTKAELTFACEELFRLVNWSTNCTSQGDQTWCHELRGRRAPTEVRGLPLPREIWCSNCKNRVAAEEIMAKVRNGNEAAQI